MKRYVLTVVFGFLLSSLFASDAEHWKYPATKKTDAADTYFGKTYKDPYRWLENLKEPEVEAWFKAQAEMTDRLLAKIPAREALAREWMALDKLKPVTYSQITYENGRVFYKKTLGGENVGKLFMREGWKGSEKLLLDPATYKASAEVTTIGSFTPSWDGKYVVLGLASGGAEWSELRVLEVESGKLLPEKVFPSQGAIGWMKDNKTFMYDAGKVTDIKSVEIELNRKTRLHKVGTEFDHDLDFFSNESYPELDIAPKEFPGAFVDESYPEYVVGSVMTVQQELRFYYAPTPEPEAKGKIDWKPLCKLSDNLVRGMVFYKDDVYAVTHENAPKYKIVRASLKQPDWAHAETVVPEQADSVQSITKSKNYLFIVYSNGIVGRLVKYDLATGKTSEVKLPLTGTVFVSCPDWKTDDLLVYLTSWTSPETIYDYNGRTGQLKKSIFSSDVAYPGFDQLVSEEVEVPGHDGTKIPLSIIHKKGMPMDGSNSCILEGYGAYGISYPPNFNIRNSVALRGVVIAFAHPRGGSEKGEAWYKAGYKTTKPNTWKDFISCAEYLVKKGYTSPAKLGGTGTSAGGILISRAITERPDLFAAAICNVGCANALRMEFSANGPVNTPEFGTVKDPVECAALFEMDGVQHVKEGVKYPALMGVAGWNDPRVAPWEPGKFVATVQQASRSDKPALMQVNYDNGHFTEEKLVTFRNFAGQVAFLLWQTGHKDFQPAE
jgi:prolyl oligopeptidase